MLPQFDLQGGAALVAARGLAVAGLLSAFGTCLFQAAVMPKALATILAEPAARVAAQLRQILNASAVCASLGLALWIVVQTAAIADTSTLDVTFGAIPLVLRKTDFGHTAILQAASLAIFAAGIPQPVCRRVPWLRLAASTAALCLQAGHGHAFSMDGGPSLLLFCDALHLLGAGAWLGGLLPLLVLVRILPPDAAAIAARWFSPVGKASLYALLLSAMVQGWVFVASIPGLVGTAYGWLIFVKTMLFGILFVFAWFNRYRFAPALLRQPPGQARRILARSIAWQTLFGIAVIAAAVILSDLPPAMHLQPLWPFAQRLSLAVIREDADFRREVVLAAAALLAAGASLILAIALRRRRLAALALALAVAWFALPHLNLLLVTAYPTSFYHSPSGFTDSSIVEGGQLFGANCTACHGQDGTGHGPLAASLPVPPADLTAAHLWAHGDGELFWWISHGIMTPENRQAMPGFAATLDEDSRWALIDYTRAANAGATRRATGGWSAVLKAPDFGMRCSANAPRLSDLRGRFIRVVFGPAALPSAPAGVTTIFADMHAGGPAPGGVCVTSDATVGQAYATIAGVPTAAIAGMQFLVDEDGWLRVARPPHAVPGWDDPAILSAELRTLRAAPPRAADAAAAPMHMKM